MKDAGGEQKFTYDRQDGIIKEESTLAKNGSLMTAYIARQNQFVKEEGDEIECDQCYDF